MCSYVSDRTAAMYANLLHVKVRYTWVRVSVGGRVPMYTPCVDVWVSEGMHMCACVCIQEYTRVFS